MEVRKSFFVFSEPQFCVFVQPKKQRIIQQNFADMQITCACIHIICLEFKILKCHFKRCQSHDALPYKNISNPLWINIHERKVPSYSKHYNQLYLIVGSRCFNSICIISYILLHLHIAYICSTINNIQFKCRNRWKTTTSGV